MKEKCDETNAKLDKASMDMFERSLRIEEQSMKNKSQTT